MSDNERRCPCGSGRKYKRCCGRPKVDPSLMKERPKMDPKAMREQMAAHMSPEILQELEGMFRRLPPAALQKLQTLSVRAMRGEDVQAEMMQLMHKMPPEFLSHMMSMGMNPAFREAQAQMQGGAGVAPDVDDAEVLSEEMSVDQAKRVIEAAVKDGTMTREEADAILASS